MVQHGKECRTSIIPVLLYQVKGFGQQLDTGTKLVFFAAVFEPQIAAVIRKQVIPCNGNGVGISCSGIAGKEKEISCKIWEVRCSGISKSRIFSKDSRLRAFGVFSFG